MGSEKRPESSSDRVVRKAKAVDKDEQTLKDLSKEKDMSPEEKLRRAITGE